MTAKEKDESTPESARPSGPRWLLDPRAAGGRLLVSLAVASLGSLLTGEGLPLRVRAVVGWDAGALTFLVLAWLMMLRASAAETRQRAAIEDPGRFVTFVIAVVASLFSLFAAVGILRQTRSLPAEVTHVWTGLAIGAVALSWLVTHTAFTLRYAHLYYRRRGTTHCLQFPGNDAPNDIDFAYFAFTVGMTFQVSDVVVTSSAARRVVLLHALVSFVFGTTILALSLNLVASLLGQV